VDLHSLGRLLILPQVTVTDSDQCSSLQLYGINYSMPRIYKNKQGTLTEGEGSAQLTS